MLRVAADMRDRELDPKIVVDASHANAPGGYREQLTVVDEIARMCRNGSQLVRGIMLESHLKA
ncbi:MAG: hypothetical protein H6767_04655 [Candidatus Peribacteria bacterium]|nr:MAG: hypothetical protein H6767_04655 [Candidatus Peribacteria bacterium]